MDTRSRKRRRLEVDASRRVDGLGTDGESHPGSPQTKTNDGFSSTSIHLVEQKGKAGDGISESVALDSCSIDNLEPYRVQEVIGGDVFYLPNFVEERTADEWFDELAALDSWYHPKLKVYGKEVTQSRSIAAYATSSSLIGRIKYSGHTVNVHGPDKYTPLLSRIQEIVERVAFLPARTDLEEGIACSGGVAAKNETFNHVMLNQYADGNEYIGKHRDNEENKVIASLSLGAPRTFIMTPAGTSSGKGRSSLQRKRSAPSTSNATNMDEKPKPEPHKWVLANGSLLIMRGSTQQLWKHEIPKEPKVKHGRISLTFRQLDFGGRNG